MAVAGTELNVVTGAFSFSGSFIAERLLAEGRAVRTLTGHPERDHPLRNRVSVARLDFEDHETLVGSLRGGTTLYNTYWIRFPRGQMNFEAAVENTKKLLGAAVEAGVRRVVHLSVTNPARDSPFPYFRAKALAEQAIVDSGLSYAIIRPALIFGPGGVLVNNIAWMLRHLPFFVAFGTGEYRVHPVFAGDLAEIAVAAAQRTDNLVVDALGPAAYTFDEFVRLIAAYVGKRARIIHLPLALAVLLAGAVGFIMRDVVTTRNEAEAMMSNLLVSGGAPNGHTRFSDWLEQRADDIGTNWVSDLKRHYR